MIQKQTIYLVRHGENPANVDHIFSYKVVDYSLNAKGQLQAAQTAAFLKDKNITQIYASPLKRASETGQALAALLGVEMEITESFREVNIGSLETGPVNEDTWRIHNQVFIDWRDGKLDARFPDGENYYECAERFQAGYQQALAQSSATKKPIAIFGHGGNFICGLSSIFFDDQETLKIIFGSDIGNGSVTTLEITYEGSQAIPRLISWADINHLSGEAADQVNSLPELDD